MNRILLFSVLMLFAFTCNANDFTYTTSASSAKITKYNGSDKSVIFPTTLTDGVNSYPVTSIEGSLGSPVISSTTVEDIYIPAGITKIQFVTEELTSLKTVVIEDGVNMTSVNHAFNVKHNFYNLNFDNIIVLSKCNSSSSQLISNTNDILLFKAGEIKVYYQGDQEGRIVQIYLFDKGYYTQRPFGSKRFNYLLSALQKSGKDISTITKIDLSNLLANNTKKHAIKFTFIEENYNPSSELSYGAKVIISDTETYTVSETRTTDIPDKADFIAPQYSIITDINYIRDNTLNWNSVCLPFDIKESDFGGSSKIYEVTEATNEQIYLSRVDTEETVVKAGTPCFIYSTADTWNLSLSNVKICNTVAPQTKDVGDYWQVIGSFTNVPIGADNYKLSGDGTVFGRTSSVASISPFRCYIAPVEGSSNAPARLNVNINDETFISLVPNDATPQRVKLYDLMGRPRKEGAKGIFIKSTR